MGSDHFIVQGNRVTYNDRILVRSHLGPAAAKLKEWN
jgi:hypothetical protein